MVLTGFVAEIRERLGKGDCVPADAIIDCASRRQMVKGYNRICHNSFNFIIETQTFSGGGQIAFIFHPRNIFYISSKKKKKSFKLALQPIMPFMYTEMVETINKMPVNSTSLFSF